MDNDGWGASRREPEPTSGWMASQWMPSGILELLWPPNCQMWGISFLSEWECYQEYFVVWVYVRCCVGGVCRYLICIQTWCRDWDESPRDPGLWAWPTTRGSIWVVSLGERLSIFCLQEGEWITLLVIRRAKCGSHISINYFWLSTFWAHKRIFLIERGLVTSSGHWISGKGHLRASTRQARASVGMIQMVTAPSAPVQNEEQYQLFWGWGMTTHCADTLASFKNADWCIQYEAVQGAVKNEGFGA